MAGDGQVNFKICFKLPLKKISCKDMEIKKNPAVRIYVIRILWLKFGKLFEYFNKKNLGSISVSGQLHTYPFPNPTCYNKACSCSDIDIET